MSADTPLQRGPLSLNELLFFVTRATVGAGNPYGAGEEAGRAAQVLAKAGCDPAPLLATVLDNLANVTSGANVSFEEVPGVLVLACQQTDGPRSFSALCAGITAGDWLLAAGEKDKVRIDLRAVDSPQFAAAVALSIAQAAGRSLRFYRLTEEGGGRPTALSLAELPPEGPGDFTLQLADPADGDDLHLVSSADSPAWDGVLVDAAAWDKVMGYFHQCLVPSTAESRLSGAGAGLLDED